MHVLLRREQHCFSDVLPPTTNHVSSIAVVTSNQRVYHCHRLASNGSRIAISLLQLQAGNVSIIAVAMKTRGYRYYELASNGSSDVVDLYL